MKPFEIFRTGNHTSSQGKALTFSEADVAAIAASYDPALHQAPIVVGHPKTNMPAFGWIKSLSVKGDRLVAEPDRLDPAFAEMVKDGKFLKVSAALYDPASKGNPTPGSYHLRHVGFLGAEPPAVKGLAAIEFAEGEEIILEFADTNWRTLWGLESIGRLFRGLRDHFIATTDLETADRFLPQYQIDELTQMSADLRAEARVEDLRPSFSETHEDTSMTTAQTAEAERLAALDAREAALNSRETTFSETEKKAKAEADAAFVDGVVKAGRLPIGLQATAVALFSELSDDVLTFSEGGASVETSPRAAFRSLLEKLPVPVVAGELAQGDGPDFSDSEQVADAITKEITEAKARGEDLSPAQAAMRLKTRR
ncbi:peptidase [Rhizobium sp. CC-YZS058]|uniref:peptidase n=1 Tax=Rhizobium sp. CC-YZS058 TaxID=3042153 RepID=UPI002B0611E7|nr:peptidase [Rhizobium sp. CC-YZS058]MEA3533718.1 peptidase [Rhizobium sp. CC-YZS058]